MEARSDAINICEMSIDQVEAENEHRAVEKARTKLENLPLPLIHHIMDCLSPKDSKKFSILSKTFNSSWLTYLVLHFDNDLFPIQDPHAFNASVHRYFQHRAPHILRCLRKLSIPYNALHPMLSSEFITTLKLSSFTLLIPDPVITCPALKLLSITFCTGFQTLHVVSPSLVEVEILRCQELKSVIEESDEIECFKFSMYLENVIVSAVLMVVGTKILHILCSNLPKNMKIYNPNVEILQLENCGIMENLVVCAPNVECFEDSQGFWGRSYAIDISACVCLTLLALKGAIITDGWVKSLVSALACLEELKIIKCDMLEKIEFKNARLETLVVEGCSKLKAAMVDAPNLLHFLILEVSTFILSSFCLQTAMPTSNCNIIVHILFLMTGFHASPDSSLALTTSTSSLFLASYP
ncbi:F-box/LRR-repeat protein [Senna tora]|uniref:F-box/LRR-repeat protein n=1 Tax=Senna tora TaxID=362788 RepID=A0A834WAT2_9FABA|nr:F-box/LRR-repeat protein [Senna tora]